MTRSFRWAALSLALLLATAVTAAAQTNVSVRAGLSLASLGGDEIDGLDSRTGLNVGAAVAWPLTPTIDLQVGASYAQKGASGSDEDVDVTVAIDYIEVPVLLRLAVPMAGTLSPHFFVGPAVSFEAGCDIEGSADGASVSFPCSEAELETKSIDFGGMAGAGLSMSTAGTLSVTLDVLFNLGLTNIDDSGTGDSKNRAWSILAGVDFPIG